MGEAARFAVTAARAKTAADAARADAEAFGIPVEAMGARDEVFYLWPEAAEEFSVWLRCQTQWFVDSMGARIGLNYPGVEVVIRRRGHRGKAADAMFDYIQTMEFEVLAVDAEMRKDAEQ